MGRTNLRDPTRLTLSSTLIIACTILPPFHTGCYPPKFPARPPQVPTYHLNIIQDPLRCASGQHLRTDKVHQRRFRLADVLDNLLVDPRPNLLLDGTIDLVPIQWIVEQIGLLRWYFVDNTLDVPSFLLLRFDAVPSRSATATGAVLTSTATTLTLGRALGRGIPVSRSRDRLRCRILRFVFVI